MNGGYLTAGEGPHGSRSTVRVDGHAKAHLGNVSNTYNYNSENFALCTSQSFLMK
jgi:hypothetical protein